MKKKSLVVILATTGLLVSACSKGEQVTTESSIVATEQVVTSEEKKEEKKEEIAKLPVKSLGDLDVSIGEIKITESESGDKMVNIPLSVTNQSTIEGGIGAFEFKLKLNDQSYNVYDDRENINGIIEGGGTLEGNLNFEIPNASEKAELIYSVDDDKSVSWDIQL